jgi:hypothetical protein
MQLPVEQLRPPTSDVDLATEPVYDDKGVDLTLVRKMLRLSPEERLRYMQEVVEDILETWQLNGTRPLR